MTEKDASALIELLYPHFIKKYKEDINFKQTVQMVNATFIAYDGKGAIVKINPFDKETISATINISEPLSENDSVVIIFNESLKNAKIIAKN